MTSAGKELNSPVVLKPSRKAGLASSVGRARASSGANRFRSLSTAHAPSERRRPVRILKFGGTSLDGALCLARVAAIIGEAARPANVAVIASATAGTTDQLLQAGKAAETGDGPLVADILDRVHAAHLATAAKLLRSSELRASVVRKIDDLLGSCRKACLDVMAARKLTSRERDLISGFGERLSIPLLAGALVERGMASEPIEATELIVTDSNYGEAEPLVNRTREMCAARLRPLVSAGVVPVITGFIGATSSGLLTTLGRGGSDYSATIIAAALKADEVVIWTDVDGIMSADPRMVPGARLVSEISYQQASELAFFGAKVLHPKTLDAIAHAGIPLWVRNTSTPESLGTRITPKIPHSRPVAKAVASTEQVTLLTITGVVANQCQTRARAVEAINRVAQHVLLQAGSPSPDGLALVVCSVSTGAVLNALRGEFRSEFRTGSLQEMRIDSSIALVTAVGSKLSHGVSHAQQTLENAGVEVIATSTTVSGCSMSFLVPVKDAARAQLILHRELIVNLVPLDTDHSRVRAAESEAYGAD